MDPQAIKRLLADYSQHYAAVMDTFTSLMGSIARATPDPCASFPTYLFDSLISALADDRIEIKRFNNTIRLAYSEVCKHNRLISWALRGVTVFVHPESNSYTIMPHMIKFWNVGEFHKRYTVPFADIVAAVAAQGYEIVATNKHDGTCMQVFVTPDDSRALRATTLRTMDPSIRMGAGAPTYEQQTLALLPASIRDALAASPGASYVCELVSQYNPIGTDYHVDLSAPFPNRLSPICWIGLDGMPSWAPLAALIPGEFDAATGQPRLSHVIPNASDPAVFQATVDRIHAEQTANPAVYGHNAEGLVHWIARRDRDTGRFDSVIMPFAKDKQAVYVSGKDHTGAPVGVARKTLDATTMLAAACTAQERLCQGNADDLDEASHAAVEEFREALLTFASDLNVAVLASMAANPKEFAIAVGKLPPSLAWVRTLLFPARATLASVWDGIEGEPLIRQYRFLTRILLSPSRSSGTALATLQAGNPNWWRSFLVPVSVTSST